MALWLVAVVWLAAVRRGEAGTFDWCKHDCREYGKPQAKHSLCVLPAGGGQGCSSYRPGLTKEEQQYILDMHNEVRAKVANGHEKRGIGGEQPKAADMMELVWDDEVAMIAQRWADQCRTGGHDQCRQTMDGVPNGQNVAITRGTGMDPSRTSLIADMCNTWFNEVKDMATSDVDAVFRSSDPTKKIGHYTQAVWGRTTRIGCAMVHLRGGAFAVKLVCNYKMNGNYRETPIYTRGKPASKCPSYSRPSTKYPGLCTVTGPEDFSIPTIMVGPDGSQTIMMGSGSPFQPAGFSSSPSHSDGYYSDGPGPGTPTAAASSYGTPSSASWPYGEHPLDMLMAASLFPQRQRSSNGFERQASAPVSSPRSGSVFSNPYSNTPDVIFEVPLSPNWKS